MIVFGQSAPRRFGALRSPYHSISTSPRHLHTGSTRDTPLVSESRPSGRVLRRIARLGSPSRHIHGPTGPSSVRPVAVAPDAENRGSGYCHILIRMEPKERLRLESVMLHKPERNCANRRDVLPVTADWRNGQIGALLIPALGCDWNVAVR